MKWTIKTTEKINETKLGFFERVDKLLAMKKEDSNNETR